MNYFKESEFECKCGCGLNNVKDELKSVLNRARHELGKPIVITSATRCKKHNKVVGGAKKSKHLLGMACDIQVKDITPREVYKYLDSLYAGKYGVILYNSFVHIDIREIKYRKDNRT